MNLTRRSFCLTTALVCLSAIFPSLVPALPHKDTFLDRLREAGLRGGKVGRGLRDALTYRIEVVGISNGSKVDFFGSVDEWDNIEVGEYFWFSGLFPGSDELNNEAWRITQKTLVKEGI